MAKCWVLMFLVLALVLVLHATARNMPDTEKKDTIDDVANSNNNHEQANVNVVNVPKAMGANGKAVKDKKCGVVFGGLGGAAGVGGVAGVIPLGGIGGIGGLGGAGGVGGAAGKGGGIGIIP